MPVRTKQRCVDDTHVRPEALDVLHVPYREGIVVSVGDEDPVFPDTTQVVHSQFAGRMSVAAVVVVPVLGCHEGRDSETGSDEGDACEESPASSGMKSQPHHSQTDPYAEEIE